MNERTARPLRNALVVTHALCPQTAPHRPAALAIREERANKWVVLALSSTGAFMTTLDTSIVNISLPSSSRQICRAI